MNPHKPLSILHKAESGENLVFPNLLKYTELMDEIMEIAYQSFQLEPDKMHELRRGGL